MVVPAALAVIWALAAAPAFMGLLGDVPADPVGGFFTSLVTAVAGFIAAVRWVSAKPADYSTPMVAVGIGAMPPGMLFSILRGIDMVALITLPLVFGWSHWISIVIAVVAFGFLRSGVDRETMMEQQQEQKRQMEEAKAQRQGGPTGASREKIKVQRRR